MPTSRLDRSSGKTANVIQANEISETDLSDVDSRRMALRELLRPYADVVSRAKRAYFDQPSFALEGKHHIEFQIKSEISNHFQIPFRSVVFTGSSQLGFSQHKDRPFTPGSSDLDVACIDSSLFQRYWQNVLDVTHAFTDQSKFVNQVHADRLKDQLLKRGMIFLEFLPRSALRTESIGFLNEISLRHRHLFKSVTVAVYINENAFCWKQSSALFEIMGGTNAK